MKIVVFLGPSLPLDQAREILPHAVYLPPAGQGDLLSVVTAHGPRVIVLIDGFFDQSLSVWHKEILFALEKGVWVYGASSMGALRAAETGPFGMIGVGRIHQWYASGEVTDDDEVALWHGEAETGYYNVSQPMVNLRATFLAAREAGVIGPRDCRLLIAAGKELFYQQRQLEAVLAQAARMGLAPDALEAAGAFAREHFVDQKALDARECLQKVAALPGDLPPFQAGFTLTRSHLFSALYDRDRWVEHQGTRVSLSQIAQYAATHLPEFNRINFAALNRALAVQLADLLEVTVDAAWVEEEEKRLCRRHGLSRPQGLEQWLRDNDLSWDDFQELLTQLARCRRLHRWLLATKRAAEGSTRLVLDQLRLEGLYGQCARGAAQQNQVEDNLPEVFVRQDASQVDLPELVREHLTETECLMDAHFLVWGEEAGFADPLDLKFELLRGRNHRRAVKRVVERMLAGDGREARK